MNNQPVDDFEPLLRHVVRTAPMPEPPANFATELMQLLQREKAQHVQQYHEDARVEIWLTFVALLCCGIAVLIAAVPMTDLASASLLQLLADAPWPLLLAVTAVFAVIKTQEALSGHHSGS